MPCFYCGKRISMVRQMADQDFCSDEHRRRYQDLGDAILRRLSESDVRPAARAGRGSVRSAATASGTPKPAAARRPAPQLIVPAEAGPLGPSVPGLNEIASRPITKPSDVEFAKPVAALAGIERALPERRLPPPFTLLKAAAPALNKKSGPQPGPEPAPVFASRAAEFASLVARRYSAVRPRTSGFFCFEPEGRRRSARQRVIPAPRFMRGILFMPEMPAPHSAGPIEPSLSGPIPPSCWPVAPLAAAPHSTPFESFASASLVLPLAGGRRASVRADQTTNRAASQSAPEWRITTPSPVPPPAAIPACPATVDLPWASPVEPSLGTRTLIRGMIGSPGMLPAAVAARAVLPRLAPQPGTACDSWPVLLNRRIPSRATRAPEAHRDLPETGLLRRDLPRAKRQKELPNLATAPTLTPGAVRTPGGRSLEHTARMPEIGWQRCPMPAARTRPVAFSDILRPPILTVVPVLPEVFAAWTSLPCRHAGHVVRPPAAVIPAAVPRQWCELSLNGAAPAWPPLAVSRKTWRLPEPGSLTTPHLGLRQITSVWRGADAVFTASPICTGSHAPRPVRRALIAAGTLPVAVQPVRVASRHVPASATLVSQAPALPAVPSRIRTTTPVALPARMPVVSPHAGAPGPSGFDFLNVGTRAAAPPRHEGDSPAQGIQAAELVPGRSPRLQVAAPEFMRALPAPALNARPSLVPASPPLGVLSRELPAPSTEPLPDPARAVQIACSAREAEVAFSAAVELLSPVIPLCVTRPVAIQALLPCRLTPAAVRHALQEASAEIPAQAARPGHFVYRTSTRGLGRVWPLLPSCRAANFLSGAAGEDWVIPAAQPIEFSHAATRSTLRPRLKPARAVIANVRLVAVDSAHAPVLLSEAPRFSMCTLIPATPASGRPAVSLVALIRENLPVVREDVVVTRPSASVESFSMPQVVTVLNRFAPLPEPGYPAYGYTAYEVLDFDDDDTCVLAGMVESEPSAPVLPQSRISRTSARLLALCGPLTPDSKEERVQPAYRPAGAVDFSVEPQLLVMPSGIGPEMDDEGYPVAAGEGTQLRWPVGSRLFR